MFPLVTLLFENPVPFAAAVVPLVTICVNCSFLEIWYWNVFVVGVCLNEKSTLPDSVGVLTFKFVTTEFIVNDVEPRTVLLFTVSTIRK